MTFDKWRERFTGADDDVEQEAAPAAFWTVAIYLIDKVYGGPEEGGWYYTAGQRVDEAVDGVNPNDLLTVLPNEIQAGTYAALLQSTLDVTVNVGRRDISSVLSEGRYEAQAHPLHPPAYFPQERPHYE